MNTQAPPKLPDVPLPEPARLPGELKEAVGWIVWRAEWKRNGSGWKLNKVPCNARGVNCSMTAANVRGSLSQALATAEKLRKKLGPHFGVGITMCAMKGVIVLDLDGDLACGPSERLTWLRETAPTWAEASVSGKGAHLFFKGTFEGKRKIAWRGAPLEIFGSTGFVAVTGTMLPGAPTGISTARVQCTGCMVSSRADLTPTRFQGTRKRRTGP